MDGLVIILLFVFMSNASDYESPRKLLETYLNRLEDEFRPAYEKASNFSFFFWHGCTLVSVISGFAAAITSAVMPPETFSDQGKVWLTVISAIGGVAAALLTQFRFRELEDLRETGRIEIEDIISFGWGKYAQKLSDEELYRVYEEIRERVKKLESSQHRRSSDLYVSSKKKEKGNNE